MTKAHCLRCGRQVTLMKRVRMFRRHVAKPRTDGKICKGSWEFVSMQLKKVLHD